MCFRGIQHGHDLVKLADGRVFIKEGTTLTPQKMENIIKVNRLYLIDQNPDSVHLGAIQIYDPEKDIFSVQFALHAFRESGSVFLLPDNKVLFFGGHGSGLRGWTKEIEIYNPRSGRSDVVGSISNMNQKYEPALIKNRYILIIGDKQQVFDIQTHNTMNVGPMFVLREGTMTRLQNGDVLIAGGLNFKAGEKSRMAEIFKLFH
jgi:hypothetical protein